VLDVGRGGFVRAVRNGLVGRPGGGERDGLDGGASVAALGGSGTTRGAEGHFATVRHGEDVAETGEKCVASEEDKGVARTNKTQAIREKHVLLGGFRRYDLMRLFKRRDFKILIPAAVRI
jgi:hypothetical protein